MGAMALMVQMIISFIRYKWCRDQDDSLGGLSVQYIIWLEEECGGSAVYADEAGSTEDTIYSDIRCRCGYISALTDRGSDVFSSISVKCLYPLHMT